MTTKQELKDRLAARTAEAINLRREVNALNRELTAAQSNQARAIRERDEARAQLAAARADLAQAKAALTELRQADTPEPRPFRVGDRVRVAEGATYKTVGDLSAPSWVGGRTGRVTTVAVDGDLYVWTGDADDAQGHASPEFCTLIAPESEPDGRVYAIRSDTPPGLVVTEDGSLLNWEGENYVRQPATDRTPEPTTPAPIARVRVVYESGGLSQDFDADGIAVMEAAPVYALLKDGAVVACVPVAGVRSVEVVR